MTINLFGQEINPETYAICKADLLLKGEGVGAENISHTPRGSRIALVHNGSALFTGDAGQGESNIRRWAIENDWLEAVIALPLNIFYNTGIATYIWILTNRKADYRRSKVQLIDATAWYPPLRRNLGKKNYELGEAEIARVLDRYPTAPCNTR
nr:N-6 DNA methylase [uncultured Thiodictyon sp.]